MSSMKMIWHGDKVSKTIIKSANNRLLAAGIHLQNAVKKNISIPSYTSKKQLEKMNEDGSPPKPPSRNKKLGSKSGGKSKAELWNDFQTMTKGKFKGKNRGKAGAAWKTYKAKNS